jgi:hypothetical protein
LPWITPSGFTIGINLKTNFYLKFTASDFYEIKKLIIPFITNEPTVSAG